jgi:large subunit ribosomal protein L29
MKPVEIRELDTEELHSRIAELREELFNLRFQLATGQLDNHRRMREVRRDIARIRTVLRERDFAYAARTATAAAPAPAPAPAPQPVPPAAPPAEPEQPDEEEVTS